MSDLGNLLKRLRLEHGLSQREAARQLGVSSTRLSDFERGTTHGTSYKAIPPRDFLEKAAVLYDHPLDNLLGLAGLPAIEPQPVPRPSELEAQEREVLHIMRTLDDEKRGILVQVVKAFKPKSRG